jgi:putative FmdB family regulatory protein
MPLYEFRCPDCGPFDLHREMRDPPQAATCPQCTRPARRVYSFTPGNLGRGPLRDAVRADRARIDRARSGEPVITEAPTGRRLPRTGHRH